MDEDAVADELYRSPLAEFLPTRTERAKTARAAGDRDLAIRISALRKPTVAAWLVNQIVHRHPDEIEALDELAEQLRSAHQHGDGDLIRAAGQQRRTLLRHLDTLVRQVSRAAGQRLGTDTAGQVARTFQAALVDPTALATVRSGRLHATVEQGADVLDRWPGMDSTPRPRPIRTGPPEFPAPPAQPAARPTRTRPAEPAPAPPPPPPPPPPPSAELIRAIQLAEDSAAARDRADQELTAAQEHANQTRERAEVARTLLTRAIREHEEALAAVAEARTAVTAADRAAKAAHQAVTAIQG
jgi:hypothetical protein